MRISDWSSDVCSSDLAAAALSFREVADGIFVRFGLHEEVTAENCGAIANLGFIIGGKSVAVVDTGTTRQEGEALRAAVAVATDRPISHVVATHVHFDHCSGHRSEEHTSELQSLMRISY